LASNDAVVTVVGPTSIDETKLSISARSNGLLSIERQLPSSVSALSYAHLTNVRRLAAETLPKPRRPIRELDEKLVDRSSFEIGGYMVDNIVIYLRTKIVIIAVLFFQGRNRIVSSK
jgi:hypothetical protein